MSQVSPKYLGKWEGEVIKVLVLHENEFVNFKILETKTGLTPNGLKSALHTLYDGKIIQKEGEGPIARYLLVDEAIKKEWKSFLGKEQNKPEEKQKSVPETKQVQEQKPTKIENDELIQWLVHWTNERPINQPIEAKHFFLEGMRLEEFTRDVIGKAKDEILVTNPYLDSCYLTTALQEARDRRANVKIVSRRPTKDKTDISKIECHAAMRKKGSHYSLY